MVGLQLGWILHGGVAARMDSPRWGCSSDGFSKVGLQLGWVAARMDSPSWGCSLDGFSKVGLQLGWILQGGVVARMDSLKWGCSFVLEHEAVKSATTGS